MSAATDEIGRRKEFADKYYSNYVKTLREGDLGKASEFLYGVITNLIYALGLLDNVKLGDHARMKEYLTELAASRGDSDMGEGFLEAEAMHANFYHNYMSKDLFQSKRGKVEGLAIKLTGLLSDRLKEAARLGSDQETDTH